MTKIDAFISKVQDEKIPLSSLLRSAKLLAQELGQHEFLIWLNSELEGYKDSDKHPNYRTLVGQMKAWNPIYGWVPVIHKSSEIEKNLCSRRTNQPIREIEELVEDKSDTYEMPYPSSVASQVIEGDIKTKLSMFVSRSSLVGILESVRNRLLDWAVELKKSGVLGKHEEFTPTEKEEAKVTAEKFNIGNIENFNGNMGNGNEYLGSSKILTEKESFWSKAFWYILVAFFVVVLGNVTSAFINKFFGI